MMLEMEIEVSLKLREPVRTAVQYMLGLPLLVFVVFGVFFF